LVKFLGNPHRIDCIFAKVFLHMTEEKKGKKYFEVYHHPNEYTNLFLFAFETLEQAEILIEKSHSNFKKIDKAKAKHPYITINLPKEKEGEVEQIFYSPLE